LIINTSFDEKENQIGQSEFYEFNNQKLKIFKIQNLSLKKQRIKK